MSLTRPIFLRASRSTWLAEQFRQREFASRAVRRFLPGETMAAALDATEEFGHAGMGTVITNLGEQVRTPADAAAVGAHYMKLIEEIEARQLPAHISVKLTHIGLDVDAEACKQSVSRLIARSEEANSMVWIDMEESFYVDRTLEIFRGLREQHLNVGICLQAYLKRTPADLEKLLPLEPAVRLVKGAYQEPAAIAFARKQDTDEAYLQLADTLLRDGSGVTVFGTHDPRLLGRIKERADSIGSNSAAYEVHMLYGIQPRLQRELAIGGTPVRVLISYGESWFPWYMRRLAERPANVWFVVRNMVDWRN